MRERPAPASRQYANRHSAKWDAVRDYTYDIISKYIPVYPTAKCAL